MSYSADQHYGNIYKDDKYVRMRYGKYLDSIKEKLKEEVDVLDVGGYMGDLYECIKNQGHNLKNIHYFIVDYDDSAMEIAKKRGINTYKIDFNFQEIDKVTQARKFDVIVCTEVLEHLLDPAKHIAAMSTMLNEQGICVISLPNENTIFHRMYSLFGLGQDQCVFELYKHLHFPTINQSRTFVSKYFDVEKEAYYINMSGKGSRLGWIGKILTVIPDGLWQRMADIFPGLFARGVVFKLKKKQS